MTTISEPFSPQRIIARKYAFEIVENIFSPLDLNSATTFESLGIDGLSLCSLEIEVEAALELPAHSLQFDPNMRTVGDLAEFIERHL